MILIGKYNCFKLILERMFRCFRLSSPLAYCYKHNADEQS